jgi:hypothetical protein
MILFIQGRFFMQVHGDIFIDKKFSESLGFVNAIGTSNLGLKRIYSVVESDSQGQSNTINDYIQTTFEGRSYLDQSQLYGFNNFTNINNAVDFIVLEVGNVTQVKHTADQAYIYFPLLSSTSNYLSGASLVRDFNETNYDYILSNNVNLTSKQISTTVNINSGASEITFTIPSADFTDAAGNDLGTDFTFTLSVDNTAPEVSFTPSNTTFFSNNTTGQVSATMNDIGKLYVVDSSIASNTLTTEAAILALNDNQYNVRTVSASESNTTVLVSAVGLAEGYYRLYGFDGAGNRSEPSTNEFGIDTGSYWDSNCRCHCKSRWRCICTIFGNWNGLFSRCKLFCLKCG